MLHFYVGFHPNQVHNLLTAAHVIHDSLSHLGWSLNSANRKCVLMVVQRV